MKPATRSTGVGSAGSAGSAGSTGSLGGLCGIQGRPYLDLEPWVDLDELASLDDEICRALTRVPVEYTGGSHRWMGIVPPSLVDEPFIDYGEVISELTEPQFRELVSLGDEPLATFDLARFREYEFGEERDHSLNRRQMQWLELKHGVYFPWKVYYEMIPNWRWEQKSTAAGKEFTPEARQNFPRTIAFVRRLPFLEIGRCNIMGLRSNDHGTVHRDGEPDEKSHIDHFMLLCPRGNKRPFVWDETRREKTIIAARVYWFNDSDYHGVEADPWFRYSIRVDGIFKPELMAKIAERYGP